MTIEEQKQFVALVEELKTLRQHNAKLLDRLSGATNTSLQLVGRVERNTQQAEKLTDALQTTNRRLGDATDQRDYAVQALKHIQGLFDQIAAKLAAVDDKVDDVTDKHKLLGEEVDAAEAKVDAAAEEVAAVKDKLATVNPNFPWYAHLFLRMTEAPLRTQLFLLALMVIALVTALATGAENVVKFLPNRTQGETRIEPQPMPTQHPKPPKEEHP